MRDVITPWLTLAQGAKYVIMDPQPFREKVYAGEIRSHKRGERWFVNTADLDAWMRSFPDGAKVPEALRKTRCA